MKISIKKMILVFLKRIIFAALIFFALNIDAYAYIGPGAGFAFISSFFVLFVTFFLAFVTILTWPVRAAIIYFKQRTISKKGKIKRAVIIGLDGLDPALTQKLMKAGKLPHFSTLKQQGSFRALKTTTPPISPVAWSTFSTGVNPGKHRIFDFYTRDPKNYLPVLSSAHISSSKRYVKIGPFKIPMKQSQVKFLRKSSSFWKILGEHGIFSSVLRVPITFPPEKFYGSCLSAMCAPDLLGTQGTFTQFTTENTDAKGKTTGGTRVFLDLKDGKFNSSITGPSMGNDGKNNPLTIPIEGEIDFENEKIHLSVNKAKLTLVAGQYSPWVNLEFKAGVRKKIKGIVRFLVTEIKPDVKIYMTPINIDPEKPALPISHPFYFSIMLSKLRGPYATLGLSEDTWALNERVIDEGAFLKQSYDIYETRKTLLMDTLKKNKQGLVVSVFDTTDRIQHMFFRYRHDDHPANKGKDTTCYKDAIDQLYQKMDLLIGDVQDNLLENDLLIILSDHGFKSFKRGVNLNSWLYREGYLVLKNDKNLDSEWLADVDWSKTRAYAYGLAGIFFNIKGREIHGIVNPGDERDKLQDEIGQKLESLWDDDTQLKPIRRVMKSQEVMKGPYTNEAPDLLIGYSDGFRASWDSAIGKITESIIEDNTRSWSGDHSIDPQLVPGVFFSNWKLEDKRPAIEDIAPTILNLFGISPRSFHDGKVLSISNEGQINR